MPSHIAIIPISPSAISTAIPAYSIIEFVTDFIWIKLTSSNFIFPVNKLLGIAVLELNSHTNILSPPLAFAISINTSGVDRFTRISILEFLLFLGLLIFPNRITSLLSDCWNPLLKDFLSTIILQLYFPPSSIEVESTNTCDENKYLFAYLLSELSYKSMKTAVPIPNNIKKVQT